MRTARCFCHIAGDSDTRSCMLVAGARETREEGLEMGGADLAGSHRGRQAAPHVPSVPWKGSATGPLPQAAVPQGGMGLEGREGPSSVPPPGSPSRPSPLSAARPQTRPGSPRE